MQAAFHFFTFKSCFFKDLAVWKKVNFCSRCFCFSKFRQQSVFQFDDRNAPLIAVMVHIAFPADFHIHKNRQRVHDGRADAVKPSACLIGRIVKFSSGMQRSKDKACRGHAFFMHPHRNSPSVIRYGTRTVLLKRNPDRIAVSRQMLVHRIVYNFIY